MDFIKLYIIVRKGKVLRGMYNLDLLQEHFYDIYEIYCAVYKISKKVKNFRLSKESYALCLDDVGSWKIAMIDEIISNLLQIEIVSLDDSWKYEYFNQGGGLKYKTNFYKSKRRYDYGNSNLECNWCGSCSECINSFDEHIKGLNIFKQRIKYDEKFNFRYVEEWCVEIINTEVNAFDDCYSYRVLDVIMSDDAKEYEYIMVDDGGLSGWSSAEAKSYYLDYYEQLIYAINLLAESIDK